MAKNKKNIVINESIEEKFDAESNINFLKDIDFLFESDSKLDLINKLNSYFDKVFHFIESGIFFIDEQELSLVKQDYYNESVINKVYKSLVEGGIVDWLMNEKAPKILPNIYCDYFEKETFVLLTPIYFQSKRFAIFSALSNRNDYSEKELESIVYMSKYASIVLDKFISQEKLLLNQKTIKALKKNLSNLASNASIGELSANAFYEIKSPLENLLANVKLAESGVGAFSSRMKLIDANANRIKNYFSKLEELIKNSSKNNIEIIPIKDIIEEALFFCEKQLNANGIELYISEEVQTANVKGNKNELTLALLSLMFFSKELMPDGGKINLAYKIISENYASISIIDNGIGLEAEEANQVFEPDFSLTDSAFGKLNLSLAKMTIENHRGTISVFTEIGKGAAFKINLPIAKSEKN